MFCDETEKRRCEYVMEFVSSFFIVFTIHVAHQHAFGVFAIALSFFLAVFIAAKVSGAHLNGAVTYTVFLNDRARGSNEPADRYYYYFISQVAGGFFAGVIAYCLGFKLLQPEVNTNYITYVGAVFFEAIFTGILCLLVCIVSDPNYGNLDPSIIGMIVAGLIYIESISIGGLTGGVVNPSIGLALTGANAFAHGLHMLAGTWVYFAGPLLGGYVAHIIHFKFIAGPLEEAKKGAIADQDDSQID